MKNWPEFDRKIILAMSLVGFISVAQALLFTPFYRSNWSDTYFALLLFLTSATLIWCDFKSKTRPRLSLKSTLVFSGVFLAVFTFRFLSVHKVSIWGDEDLQVVSALQLGPSFAGAIQHQPPLEFAYMNAIVHFFDLSELTSRLSALIFTSLATVLLAWLGFLISESFLLAAGLTPLFGFHYLVTQYSVEARPISIGLAAAVLILWSIGRTLANRETPSLRNWFYGCAAALLALTSLGLQPPFFLFALVITTLFFPKINFRTKIWLISQWVTAVALYLPIQIFIIQNAPPRFREHSGWLEVSERLQHADYAGAFDHYGGPLLLTALLLIFLFAFKKIRKSNSNEVNLGAYFATTALLFVGILVPFFTVNIIWNLNIYYLILVWPLAILSLAAVYRDLVPLFGTLARRAAAPIILICLGLGIFLATRGFWSYRAQGTERADYRSALLEIKASTDLSPSLVLSTCLTKNDGFCMSLVSGGNIYLRGLTTEDGGTLNILKPTLPKAITNAFTKEFKVGSSIIVLLDNAPYGHIDAPSLPDHFSDILVRKFNLIDMYIINGKKQDARLGFLELGKFLDDSALAKGFEETALLPLLYTASLSTGQRDLAQHFLQLAKQRQMPLIEELPPLNDIK